MGNDEYLDATKTEKQISAVLALQDEILTGAPPGKSYGNGYDDRVYCQRATDDRLFEETEKLLSLLDGKDVSKFSLEMQIWAMDFDREKHFENKELLKLKAML
jgi:hypothetical protein